MVEPGPGRQPWSPAGTAVRLVLLAALYFALARVGLQFALSESVASPVWPPAGLAVAAVGLWGFRALPGVLAGAVAAELLTASPAVAVPLALGATGEAALGGWLVARAGGARAFGSLPGVLRFAAAPAAGAAVGATVGAAVLALSGTVPASAAGQVWWTWYLGDAAGALVVAPVLLLHARPLRERPPPARLAESAAAIAVLLAVAGLVFGLVPGVRVGSALVVLLMPPLVWAAYRVGPAPTALALLALDGVAVAVTRVGQGPFTAPDVNASFLLLQAFVFTVGLLAFGLAALSAERGRAAEGLEARIAERTRSLEDLNRRLRREAGQRQQAQDRLDEAQRLAGIGTWRWDVSKPHAEWSPELYSIYGLDPATHVPTYEDYLTRVHPDDVGRVKAATEAVFRDHRPYSHDERIRRPDGTWRNLHTWAQAELDEDGRLVALIGACQDLTERVSQELTMRGLLESAPDAMVVTGPGGRIVLVNGQAERLFGYTRAEMLGQPVDLLVPEGVRGRHAGNRAGYLADPRPRPMGAGLDLKARRKDGSEFPVEVSLSPVETPEGTLVSSAIRDISERKRSEHALQESLERFRALADASPIGIVHTRADGTVDYVNETWRQITGVRDHNDREGMRRSVHPEDQPVMAKLWRACVAEGREFAGDMRFVHADGAVRWTRARAVPVRDAAGAITGFVSALADVTEQRAAEAQEREVQRLREQAEFKTNFLRTAAHEIGTPLTPIRIQMHILRDLLRSRGPKGYEEERKAAEILERNIQRLQVLVQDMLESARLQSGRLRLAVRPFDLAHVVHDVVETFQEPAIQTGIALDTMGPHVLPVVADPDRLSQVLYNLLSNAMKFTPSGGQIHVRVVEEPGDRVRVTVEDTGAGFTAEGGARLFQPFTQLQDPTRKPHGGSGLGLYISRGIVEQHGGTLTGGSRGPGQGATFSFAIPKFFQLAAPPSAPVAEAPAAAPARPPQPPSQPQRP
jgi:protein-histidine pros-kinase